MFLSQDLGEKKTKKTTPQLKCIKVHKSAICYQDITSPIARHFHEINNSITPIGLHMNWRKKIIYCRREGIYKLYINI